MKFELVEKESELNDLVKEIYDTNCTEIAVDLEGESNLHRYGFHLCLIQIKTCSKCFLVDAVKIADLSSIRTLFADGSIQKIMYASEFDIKLLYHTNQIVLHGLFDLQPAAKLLGLEKLSLKNALETILDVKLPKSKKKQQANWNIRPLMDSLLEYAVSDVYYLIELKNKMLPQLNNNGYFEKLLKINSDIEKTRFSVEAKPYLSVKRSFRLNRKSTVFLKHFYELREHIAKENDLPVYMVMRNEQLAKISKNPPSTEHKWLEINNLSSLVKDRINDFIKAKAAAEIEAESIKIGL